MVKSDILLDDEGIDAIPASGAVDIRTGPEKPPNIQLNPYSGSITLGGGAGSEDRSDSSDGVLRIDDESANPRIFMATGRTFPPDDTENGVFVTTDGLDEHGQIYLGRVGEPFGHSTVRLDARNSQITLGGQTGSGDLQLYGEGLVDTMHLNGRDASVRVGGTHPNGSVPGASGSIELENGGGTRTVLADSGPDDTGGATLTLADHAGAATVNVSGASGRVHLGNGDAGASGVPGGIDLVNGDDERTVAIDSDQPGLNGAGLALGNAAGSTTAAIDGGTGTMTLGNATENGTVSLEDGAGMVVDLEATNGTVRLGHQDPRQGKISLELEPENGLFSVFDGDGEPVFRIDTQTKTIETAKGYSRGTIDGPSGNAP